MNVHEEAQADLLRKLRNAAAAWQNEQIAGGADAGWLLRPPVVEWTERGASVTVIRAEYDDSVADRMVMIGQDGPEVWEKAALTPDPSPAGEGRQDLTVAVDEGAAAGDGEYFDEWVEVEPSEDDEGDSSGSGSGKSGKRRKASRK